MTANDLDILMRGMAPAIREYVADAVAMEVKAIDARQPDTDALIASMATEIAALKAQVLELKAQPPLRGEKGADGMNGKDGAPGERGEKGEPGEKGLDGKDGADGLQGPAGERGERGQTGERGETGPAGERGPEGPQGRDGRDGQPGVPGQQGEKGLDGKDGRDGVDGKNGLDGFGFDDMDVQHDGERGFTFSFVKGERVKAFGPFQVPTRIYRGVYQQGKSYVYQDGATWDGSEWVCMVPTTTAKPGTPNSGWQLAVKHGRDGKDGARGLDGKDRIVEPKK